MPMLKIVPTQGEILVIICDQELVGKTFKKKNLKLEVKESFYGGEEASVSECMSALEKATVANLVGSIVKEAVKAGIVRAENVFHFQKVPHAQLVRI